MKNNQIIRELRNIDRNTFTALNSIWGFDFEKPFTTAKINGAFTINKVWKELEKKHTSVDSVVVVLMDAGEDATYHRYTVTPLEGANNINVDCRLYSTDSKVWDTFYAKGDFHSFRKISKHCYIIAQKKEQMLPRKYDYRGRTIKDESHDLSNRFEIATRDDKPYITRWCKNCGDSVSYISMVYLLDPAHNMSRFEYSPAYSYNEPFCELSEIIDKSGYLVHIKRAELKRKADELCKARAAAGFKATDNTAIINGLKGRIDSLQNAISKALEGATNSEDIRAIEKVLSSWDGLGGVFRKYERILSGEREKSFSSIAAFNEALTEENALIDKIAAAL